MHPRFLALLVLLPIGACAAPRHTLGADERPGDFTMGVVHRRDGADARYVLDATGVLRASFGEGSGLSTNPGFTRRLTDEQLDDLWAFAGAIDAPRAAQSESQPTQTLSAGEPEPVPSSNGRVIIELSGRAVRRVVILDTRNPDAAALLERLGAFAWASQP